MDLKGLALRAMTGGWGARPKLASGYSILLASPMDMPFLLRFALEAIRWIDTTRCGQILVVPDGCSDDGGAALRDAVADFDDPRLEVLELTGRGAWLARSMQSRGGSAIHWACIVNGLRRVRCEHVFLHDADAFFLEADGLERQYRECLSRNMDTLGVTARWDPFFQRIGYTIPGTWEMMFRTRWALGHAPVKHKGRIESTEHGTNEFDTMLYPQYLAHPSGRVGVMDPPPEFVHFSGTIVTYREFSRSGGRAVQDELFRVLLLSILEELIPASNGRRVTPRPGELARGLTDPSARVRYDSEVARRGYPEFRRMIDQLCGSPMFVGERAERVQALLAPFDEHWARLADEAGGDLGPPVARFRSHGIA